MLKRENNSIQLVVRRTTKIKIFSTRYKPEQQNREWNIHFVRNTNYANILL